jgi:uncharacterized protein
MPNRELTRVKRLPDKARVDRPDLDHILDSGIVAHVGTDDRGIPIVIPVAYARSGDQLLIHGSAASRLFTLLAAGAPACVTVTLLDGLVLARSLFESSMNYRSAMIFGVFSQLNGETETYALQQITEHLMPGRWAEARKPTAQELKATLTLAMTITDWSVKVGEGHPDDLPHDLTTDEGKNIWAGVVPIVQSLGAPIPDPHVPTHVQVPEYIQQWKA